MFTVSFAYSCASSLKSDTSGPSALGAAATTSTHHHRGSGQLGVDCFCGTAGFTTKRPSLPDSSVRNLGEVAGQARPHEVAPHVHAFKSSGPRSHISERHPATCGKGSRSVRRRDHFSREGRPPRTHAGPRTSGATCRAESVNRPSLRVGAGRTNPKVHFSGTVQHHGLLLQPEWAIPHGGNRSVEFARTLVLWTRPTRPGGLRQSLPGRCGRRSPPIISPRPTRLPALATPDFPSQFESMPSTNRASISRAGMLRALPRQVLRQRTWGPPPTDT